MTGRSVSWTDAQRVAALLSQVSPPKRAEPFAPAAALATFGKPAVQAAPRAPAPPPARVPAPAASVPPLQLTADNPSDRLDELLAWTLGNHRCSGAFVADDNGLTLAAHGISDAHVSIVGPLLNALIGVRAVPGVEASAGALWLGAQMMSWVEVRTEHGGFCLGTVGDEPLSSLALGQLREALATTVRQL
jgi:hypothetical protein